MEVRERIIVFALGIPPLPQKGTRFETAADVDHGFVAF